LGSEGGGELGRTRKKKRKLGGKTGAQSRDWWGKERKLRYPASGKSDCGEGGGAQGKKKTPWMHFDGSKTKVKKILTSV